MRHADLVVDRQQAMKEGFRLEVERMVDVIFRPRQVMGVFAEDAAEDVPRRDM